MAMTEAQFKKIALSFPEANEKLSYGKPSIFIAKKFFTRLRAEDDSIVLVVASIDEREMMIESDPKTFHITEHYRNSAAVLARIARIDAKTLHGMLERRWRAIAPKKVLKALSSPASAGEVPRAKRGRRGEVATRPSTRKKKGGQRG
jgi:hypothetical protein